MHTGGASGASGAGSAGGASGAGSASGAGKAGAGTGILPAFASSNSAIVACSVCSKLFARVIKPDAASKGPAGAITALPAGPAGPAGAAGAASPGVTVRAPRYGRVAGPFARCFAVPAVVPTACCRASAMAAAASLARAWCSELTCLLLPPYMRRVSTQVAREGQKRTEKQKPLAPRVTNNFPGSQKNLLP